MATTPRRAATSGARLLLETLRLSPTIDTGELADRWSRAEAGAILPLIQLAKREGAELWLQRRLKALGIALPDVIRADLKAATKQLVARSAQVDAETDNAFEILDRVGIPAIPLKSTAMRRIAKRVPYADARGTMDVDVLVPESMAQRAWDALVADGYSTPYAAPPGGHHHLPKVVRNGSCGIEIHLTTLPKVSTSEAWHRATVDGATAEFEGRVRAVPGDTELVWHTMAHSLFHAEGSAQSGIRLRHWLDTAALIASDGDIDWRRIHARIAAGESSSARVCFAWLGAAAFLAGRGPPRRVAVAWPADVLNLERLLSWRIRVNDRVQADRRWSNKLLEEGARAEAGLFLASPHSSAKPLAKVRHFVMSGVARSWWVLRG